MSADISPNHFLIVEPRPAAHIWIDRTGTISAVVCSNVPEGCSLPGETPMTALMFDASWEVTVTDLGARP